MSFSELIRKNLSFIIILPLIVAGVFLIVSLFKQPLYKSSVSLLLVQKQGEEVNAETAVKSAEQMADMLSRIVDSKSFRSAVLATGKINISLPTEPWKEQKEWSKRVKTKNITDTGILVVDVYQPTSEGATLLASTIESVLTSRAYDYLGVNADSVSIRQLNPPAPTNDKPATPNLPLNVSIGWLFGLILAMSLLLLFPSVRWGDYLGIHFPFLGLGKSKGWSYSPAVYSHVIPGSGGLIYSDKLIESIKSPGVNKDDSEDGVRETSSRAFSDESLQMRSDLGLVARANQVLADKRS